MNRVARMGVLAALVGAGLAVPGRRALLDRGVRSLAHIEPVPRHGELPSRTPLWVQHVERYPGSMSEGVRANALLAFRKPGVRGSGPGPARPATGLGNVRMNVDPGGLPQNEPAVAFPVFHPLPAVAASND